MDDREPLKQGRFLENIKGKLCADKGYIGQALFENLFLNGIQLVTKVKNNMRNSLMSIADKILLRKRALIETVNDELKNIAQIEHSRQDVYKRQAYRSAGSRTNAIMLFLIAGNSSIVSLIFDLCKYRRRRYPVSYTHLPGHV